MADLSHLSDEQLAAIAGQSPSSSPSLHHLSDEQLQAIAGKSSAQSSEDRPAITGKGLVQGALNTLPYVGMAAGGALGGIAGSVVPVYGTALGGVGGAAAGGALGQKLKADIESMIMGRKQSRGEYYGDMAEAAKNGALGEMTGQMIPAASKMMAEAGPGVGEAMTGVSKQATKTYMAAPESVKSLYNETNGDVSLASRQKKIGWQDSINRTRGELEQPALQVINSKITGASDREVGDAVKQAITQDINNRYAPFQKAYATLDQVNSQLPIADESRRALGEELKSWALEKFPQNSSGYKTVREFADAMNASNTGQQFKSVLGEISDAKTAAWNAGKHTEYGILSELQDRATGFYEKQIGDTAKRVAKGVASPEEMSFFQQMAGQQGIQEPDAAKYAKQIANDYLKSADKVNSEYGAFKQYLEGVGGQTKAKGTTTLRFLDSLNTMPSEKLVQNMTGLFEKDTRALELLKAENPQAFDAVARVKMTDILDKATGKSGLDIQKFHSLTQDLSPEARNLLLTGQEQKQLTDAVSNPKLQRLNEITGGKFKGLFDPNSGSADLMAVGSGKSRDALRDLGELSLLTNHNMVRDAQLVHSMNEMGNPAGIGRKGLVGHITGTVGGIVGGGVGAMVGGPTGALYGAGAGTASGEALGNLAGSPKVLKGAIDASQFAGKVMQQSPFIQSAAGQGVMAGARGVNSLRSAGQKP